MTSRQRRITTPKVVLPALALGGLLVASTGASASARGGERKAATPILIGSVEQQLSNPFFLTIENAERAEAKSLGATMITAASATAGDFATQVTAVQNMINRGVKGIIVDPAQPTALNKVIKEARAKGILVIAVNTETSPVNTVNATIETNNIDAGKLVGKWAKAQLGSKPAHVALLDYYLTDVTSDQRHNGFLSGFGITSSSREVAGEIQTQASVDSGDTAMANLLEAHSDINVVYGINEPMAQGAYAAVKHDRLEKKVDVVGIDGSCGGVEDVKTGELGATVMQFPQTMGSEAVKDIVTYAKTHKAPTGTINSGTVLITNRPVKGISSQNAAWGLKHCWGSVSDGAL